MGKITDKSFLTKPELEKAKSLAGLAIQDSDGQFIEDYIAEKTC